MHFNSEELLKQFGDDKLLKPIGLHCKVAFDCTECEFFCSCNLGKMRDYPDAQVSREKGNPCGYDLVLRKIDWRDDLRKNDFKPPFFREHDGAVLFKLSDKSSEGKQI
jgi:hypothetical protein